MDKRTRDAILAEAKAADAIMQTIEREEREMSDVEKETIDGHLGKAKKIEDDFKTRKAFREQFTDLTGGLGIDADPLDNERKASLHGGQGSNRAAGGMSVGTRWVESGEYKALLGGVPGGRFGEKTRVQSSPMSIPGGMKDLFFSGDRTQSAGVLVENDSRGMQAPFFERPLSVRQLFTAGSTTSDTIDYVRWASVTNNAAVVPEARTIDPVGVNGATVVTAGVKPMSTFSFDRDQTTVKTIAHWIPITKRALSDASQMRTYIDSFLRYGLEEEFEDQLLAGTGSGENFLGLYNQPGIQLQAGPGAGQDNLDVLKMARTKVQIGGRATPTAYVMNPIDWQGIELMRNDNGDFYGQGPFSLTAPRVWGLPIIESEAVAPGTAWVADWRWGTIYDREQASVTATDSHADFFIRNMVAILAEMRAAFAILRPPAFCKITLA
ncbi:MAG: phage major capsid protein [Propionibacteriaceae bacterium]